METQPNYQQFELEDFVSDASFIRWAQGKAPLSDGFWEQYIAANPQQKAMIAEAHDLVGAFAFVLPEIEDDFFDRLQNRLDESIAATEENKGTIGSPTSPIDPEKTLAIDADNQRLKPDTERKNYRLSMRIAIGIAASLLLVLAFLFYPREVTIVNGYTGIKEVLLPDSSIVILNANSDLSYADNWDPQHRQVNLRGEGFFRIKHRTENGKVLPFTVAVKDLKLHVLGTSFNVISSPENVLVTLRTGRLKVTHEDESVFMKPEEQLNYDLEKEKFSLRKVHDEDYMDWTKMEFVFNDQPVAKVTQKLAAYFDLHFHFDDPEMQKALVSGRLGLSDREETLHTLELLLNKKIEINGREVSVAR